MLLYSIILKTELTPLLKIIKVLKFMTFQFKNH